MKARNTSLNLLLVVIIVTIGGIWLQGSSLHAQSWPTPTPSSAVPKAETLKGANTDRAESAPPPSSSAFPSREIEWASYEDPVHYYSLEYPADWLVEPTHGSGMGEVSTFTDPLTQTQFYIGLTIRDRLDSVPLSKWVAPTHSELPYFKGQASLILGPHEAVEQIYGGNNRRSQIIYLPFDQRVIFLNVADANPEQQRILRHIASSLHYSPQADQNRHTANLTSHIHPANPYGKESVPGGGAESTSSINFILPFSGKAKITQTGTGGVTHNCPQSGGDSDCQALDFDTTINGMDGRIYAAEAGSVIYMDWDRSGYQYGNLVKIRHDNGMVSWYAHLASIEPPYSRASVKRGEWIGMEGNTGCAVTYNCGPHLHFMIKQGDGPLDPAVDISHGLLPGLEFTPCDVSINCGWAFGGPSLYKDYNLTGWSQAFGTNDNSLSDGFIKNHETRSIRVPVDWVLFTYTEENYSGSRQEYDGPFTGSAQLTVASLKVGFRYCPVTLIDPDSMNLPSGICGGGTEDNTPPSANGFSASVTNGRYAEITTSGVQDNNGGSGVKEVRFSAKWAGNWYGIGTDSSAPYTLTWDMCSSGVSNGDVELGMEVWDNANNKWVWSEHYGNPHITKDSACGGSGDPQPGGEWHANFWMNKGLAGYVNWDVYYLWDDGKWPYIWFDWGINGPKEGWSGDEFSLRIWRNVYFPGGRYEFRTESDDGVRVYVDGQIVVDRWWDANSGAGGGKDISSGWHEVKVEYYENTGNARLYVYWYGPGYPQPDHENPGGRISSPIHLSAVNASPLTIWAEAWDDASGVDFVRFMAHYCQGGQCGWHELGTDRNAPYNYSWDWSAIGEQHVWLAIHVADKTGKVTYDPGGWVEVDLDKTSPSAEIISPAAGAYLTGNNVQILALAGDSGSGVGSVQFFAGYADGSGEYWHDLGFDTNGSDGWNKSWDVSGVNDQRDVSFFVYAYDRANNYIGTATWATVLDRVPPTSAVQGLPATSPASFSVLWSGSDATSGVAGFDIDYQQDSGSWTRWRTGVTETSATFSGSSGHTYGFRSRAIDMAGHVEAWPSSPDALTTVSVVQPPQSLSTDIFWYAPGAAHDYLHLSNGDGTFRSVKWNIGGTYTPLVSDFNGDGADDIFWYAPGAAPDYLHLSNRDGTFRSVRWNIGGTYKPLVGDFNGDGADDIFWYAPGAAHDYLHLSNGDGTFRSVKWNIGGTYTPLVSDFNGDGADDIFWYAPGAAPDYLHLSNRDGTFRSVRWNIGGTYTPLVSDFNGDGADDIFWYAPGAAPDYLHLSNRDGTFRSVKWNIGGTYTPLVSDFNGDGADDIFWYAPGVAPDYLHLSNRDGTFRSVRWNIGGTYKPLVGDFNGDGADDIFWYAPGAAPDYLHLSNRDGTFRSVRWNIGGTYTPLVGNYD